MAEGRVQGQLRSPSSTQTETPLGPNLALRNFPMGRLVPQLRGRLSRAEFIELKGKSTSLFFLCRDNKINGIISCA